MKSIKINWIEYHNFKGIKDFKLDLAGDSKAVYGRNATGKTTLFDGFTWLLFGKNSDEVKQFSAKPLDAQGHEVLGMEPEVTAELVIDGQPTVLKRQQKEVWSKPRGQAEKVRKSDKTVLTIDDVPYKLKDFTEYINNLIDEDTFKMLTNPFAFNNLDWKKRRAILLELIDNVDDDAIIAKTKHATELRAMLGDKPAELQRKRIAAQKSELNKEIDALPGRIDEATRAIPEASSTPKKQLEEMLDSYNTSMADARNTLQLLQTGHTSVDARNQLAELQTQFNEKQASYNAANNLKTDSLIKDQQAQQTAVNEDRQAVKKAKGSVLELTETIDKLNNNRKILLAQYHSINDKTFDEHQLTCPTCGQELPADQQEDLRKKFNVNRSEQLADAVTKGKQVAADIQAKKADLVKAQGDLTASQKTFDAASQQLDVISNELNTTKAMLVPFEQTAEAGTIQKQIDEAQRQITSGSDDNSSAVEAAKKRITDVQNGINQVQSELGIQATIDAQKKRIEELKAHDAELKDKFVELDKQSFMLDEFTRAKVQVMESQINKLFKLVSFKLFETQKNGELNDICEATVDGVPYSTDLNNAARINAGLDIITTLAKHYDVSVPIFIDNAESINTVQSTGSQEISLIVSNDEKLTVQKTEEEKVA